LDTLHKSRDKVSDSIYTVNEQPGRRGYAHEDADVNQEDDEKAVHERQTSTAVQIANLREENESERRAEAIGPITQDLSK